MHHLLFIIRNIIRQNTPEHKQREPRPPGHTDTSNVV